MKRTRDFIALIIAVSFTTAAAAQSYEMTWSSVDGGGIAGATGGPYELSATLGQPDAGDLAGGAYVLRGGFLPGLEAGGGGEGCTGNEVIAKAKCKTQRGVVQNASVIVQGGRPGEVYEAVLDSGQRLSKVVKPNGRAKFVFKGKNAPPCGANGVAVCNVRRAFDCGC